MNNEIKITYETLYDILVLEKRSNEIQKLDHNFLRDILDYLREKSQIMGVDSGSPFGAEEQKKALLQIDNARKLIREIYDLRSKKIILLARDVSRTSDHLVNKSAMLTHERSLFEETLLLLKRSRENVLDSLLLLKDPLLVDSSSFVSPLENPPPPKALKSESGGQSSEDLVKVRFTQEVDRFVGPGMKTFGPYSSGDEAELPEIVANIIIKKEQGEKV